MNLSAMPEQLHWKNCFMSSSDNFRFESFFCENDFRQVKYTLHIKNTIWNVTTVVAIESVRTCSICVVVAKYRPLWQVGLKVLPVPCLRRVN